MTNYPISYQQLNKLIVSIANRASKNKEDREEIVALCKLKLIQKLSKLDSEKGDPINYLSKIFRNEAKEYIFSRNKVLMSELPINSFPDVVVCPWEQVDFKIDFERKISKVLSNKYCPNPKVLNLLLQGLSDKEIATALGKPKLNVRRIVQKSREIWNYLYYAQED